MPTAGFPAQIVDVDEGKQVRSELKSLSRGSVPTDKFTVPAGLTKVSPDAMGVPGLELGRKKTSRARPDLSEDTSEEKGEEEKR